MHVMISSPLFKRQNQNETFRFLLNVIGGSSGLGLASQHGLTFRICFFHIDGHQILVGGNVFVIDSLFHFPDDHFGMMQYAFPFLFRKTSDSPCGHDMGGIQDFRFEIIADTGHDGMLVDDDVFDQLILVLFQGCSFHNGSQPDGIHLRCDLI